MQGWCDEFARSVEMFTGFQTDVQCTRRLTPIPDAAESDQYIWWKQTFSGDCTFTTWIAAGQSTWSALGAAMSADEGGAKDLYLEMLGQAQQGAATLINSRLATHIKPQAGALENSCSSISLKTLEINISLEKKFLPPIFYAIDGKIVDPFHQEAKVSGQSRRSSPIAEERQYGNMVDHLLDLELPLSVALGRSTMLLQDVLKITSGSLVELDTKIGDDVQLFIYGKLIARGEVVSMKGNYGVRIKEIASRQERLALHGAHS